MGSRQHFTFDTAPAAQFLEAPDHPGVTFYKIEHSACPGFKPLTKRGWTLACIDRVEEEGAQTTRVILTVCPPGKVEFGRVEAIVTHPQAFLPVQRRMQILLQTGKKIFHEVARKEPSPVAAMKPGLKRLLNGAHPLHVFA